MLASVILNRLNRTPIMQYFVLNLNILCTFLREHFYGVTNAIVSEIVYFKLFYKRGKYLSKIYDAGVQKVKINIIFKTTI